MTQPLSDRIRNVIRDVPDFPKPGILFRDITPLLLDPDLFKDAIAGLWEPFRNDGVDIIAGIESRGFVLAAAMSLQYRLPLVPLRKPGKLPAATFSESYDLEYGKDALEMHRDAVRSGQRVLLVDDLLATGGTAGAATKLVIASGGELVGLSMLIELTALDGRKTLGSHRFHALLAY